MKGLVIQLEATGDQVFQEMYSSAWRGGSMIVWRGSMPMNYVRPKRMRYSNNPTRVSRPSISRIGIVLQYSLTFGAREMPAGSTGFGGCQSYT